MERQPVSGRYGKIFLTLTFDNNITHLPYFVNLYSSYMKYGPKMCVSSCLMQLNCAFLQKGLLSYSLAREQPAYKKRHHPCARFLLIIFIAASQSQLFFVDRIEFKAVSKYMSKQIRDIAFQRSTYTPQCTQNLHLV